MEPANPQGKRETKYTTWKKGHVGMNLTRVLTITKLKIKMEARSQIAKEARRNGLIISADWEVWKVPR